MFRANFGAGSVRPIVARVTEHIPSTAYHAGGRGEKPDMGDGNHDGDPRDAELKARLDRLSKAITAEVTGKQAEKLASSRRGDLAVGRSLGMGFRVASELFAGILVGGFIGWWIDRWFGTEPAGLLIMLMIGAVSGFWNVYKLAAKTGGGTVQDKAEDKAAAGDGREGKRG
jgi:ATP synthase protein I